MNWYKESQAEYKSFEDIPPREHDLDCPECGAKLRLKRHNEWGNYYECEARCGVRHGARPSGAPMGVPGDLETIALRKAAHEKFDRLWKEDPNQDGARSRWYHWLSRKLGLHKNQCHMAKMDKHTLQRAIGFCENELNQRRMRDQEKPQNPELDLGI